MLNLYLMRCAFLSLRRGYGFIGAENVGQAYARGNQK
jgi:hypothetical protein